MLLLQKPSSSTAFLRLSYSSITTVSTFTYIKTYRKWSAQIGFCTILQHFLVIFWQTTLISFSKLSFFLNILRAKRVLILIGWELQDKKKTIFCVCLFQFCKKENEIFWIISGHFTTISGHFSANYSTIFHKSKVQTVILRYLMYLYLN